MRRFIDCSNVEIEAMLIDRCIELSVVDDATQQRFRLKFDDCCQIELRYSRISEWDESNLANLTQGIEERSPTTSARLVFAIHFADDSEQLIECNRFTESPIEGYGSYSQWPSE